MAKAHLEGKSWAEVAAEFGVSRATAKRSARELASTLTPVNEGTEALNVEGIVGKGLRAQRKALDTVVELLDSDSPVTRIAAAGVLARLRSSFIADLRAVGLISAPDVEAERQRHEAEVVRLANEMVAAVQRFEEAARGIEEADPVEARAALRAAADELVAAFDQATDAAQEPREVLPVVAGRVAA